MYIQDLNAADFHCIQTLCIPLNALLQIVFVVTHGFSNVIGQAEFTEYANLNAMENTLTRVQYRFILALCIATDKLKWSL